MIKQYGSVEFSKLTGISRATLFRLNRDGKLEALKDSKGKLCYNADHFLNSAVNERMKKKGIVLPDKVKQDLLGLNSNDIPVKPVAVEVVKEKSSTVLPFTSEKKLLKIKPGLITEYINPLSNMNQLARDIWNFTLKDLIDLRTIHKSDLHILKNYCMTQSAIVEMESLLSCQDYVSVVDGRINPLVPNIDKYKNTLKSMALLLNITSQGRKDLKDIEPASDDDDAWGKLGVVG